MYEPCFPIYHIFAENEGRVPVYVADGRRTSISHVGPLSSRPCRPCAPNRLPHQSAQPDRQAHGGAGYPAHLRGGAASDTLVVLDEAYIHFTETEGGIAARRGSYPNLIVLRTFSKAFGLAGLRLGFGIAANPSSSRR